MGKFVQFIDGFDHTDRRTIFAVFDQCLVAYPHLRVLDEHVLFYGNIMLEVVEPDTPRQAEFEEKHEKLETVGYTSLRYLEIVDQGTWIGVETL